MPITNPNLTAIRLKSGVRPQSASSNRRVAKEYKTLDVSSTLECNTTSASLLLSGIVPGVGVNQRIGRQVLFKKLELTCKNLSYATSSFDQYHRVLVVRDRQANGIACYLSQVLEDLDVRSFYDISYQYRFQILVDRRIQLQQSANSGSQVIWNTSVPMNFIEQFTVGTSGGIGDIVSNSVWIFVLGTVASGNGSGSCVFTARLSYTDS